MNELEDEMLKQLAINGALAFKVFFRKVKANRNISEPTFFKYLQQLENQKWIDRKKSGKKNKPVYSLPVRESNMITVKAYHKLLNSYEKKIAELDKLNAHEFFEKAQNYAIELLHLNKFFVFKRVNNFTAKSGIEKRGLDDVIKRPGDLMDKMFTRAKEKDMAGWERMLSPILYHIDRENPNQDNRIF